MTEILADFTCVQAWPERMKKGKRSMEKQTSEANPNLNFNQITDMLNVGFALTLCHKYQLFGAMKIKWH